MSLLQDARYACRVWRAHPLLMSAAVLSLALGMGANTAVFSVLNALLLRTAPVSAPGTLLSIYSTSAKNPGLHGTSFQNFEDLRDALPIDVVAYAPISVGLAVPLGLPEQITAELVSGNYFQMLGVSTPLGRAFTAMEDESPDASALVVISDALWRRRFGARLDIAGATVRINARPFAVVGVAPPEFTGIDVMRRVDLWIPSSMQKSVLTGVQSFYFQQRSGGMFDLLARPATPMSAAQVLSMLRAQATGLEQAHPGDNKGLSFAVRPFRQARMSPAQRETWVRAGALLALVTGLVLLVACANVANLLLARSAARRREISVRLAIGASRAQLARQLMVESVLLSSIGAPLGLLIAYGSLRVLSALRPAFMPPSFDVSLDGRVLIFTSLLAVVTSLLFGLAPALHAAHEDLVEGFQGARTEGRQIARRQFSRALLAAQSTLATVALVLAALFLRSLQHAQQIDPGFDLDRLAVVSFDLGMLQYDNTQGPLFVARVNERVGAMPGVLASAVSSHVVLDGPGLTSKIRLAGQENAEALGVHAQAVGTDYFRTMGIALVEGRTFRPTDTGASQYGWAIVNQTLASRMWPGRSAIGQQFALLGIKEPYVVVGTVADSQYETLGEAPQPYFYIYYDQAPGIKKLTLFVRTVGEPRAMLDEIAREVRVADPNLPLVDVRTMKDVMTDAMWAPRIGSTLLTLFGVLALVLALVGTYGVTAFFVTERRREIGIRVALGATPGNILVPVMRSTLLPSLVGLALGLLIAWLGGTFVARLLIGVAPTDAPSFAGTGVVLAFAATAASFWPAVAAMRLDPARVLRRD